MSHKKKSYNKRIQHGRYLTAAVMAVSLACLVSPSRPAYSGSELRRWAYMVPGTVDIVNECRLHSIKTGYHTICVTGLRIGKNGSVTGNIDKIVEIKKALNTQQVIPMMTFKSVHEGNEFLRDKAAWRALISEVSAIASKYGFPAVHLDFEYLAPSGNAPLAEFLVEFGASIKKYIPGFSVSMAIFPQVDFPEKWSGFHSLDRIAPHLDEIVIMCYDYHRADTGPGPVVDIAWAEKNIRHALNYFRPGQVWLGIPSYGYAWPLKGKAKVLSARNAVLQAEKSGAKRDASGTLHYSWSDGKTTYTAYISDAHTRRLLSDAASRYGLKGTAMWRLGLDDE